jgi:TATA-box binding protein (TBP) (component of TFIID and TFIIIB)
MTQYKNIWREYDFVDYLDVEKNEIKNLPEGVSISTMCGNCKLGGSLNLQNIIKYLPLNSNDILTVKVNKDKMRSLIPIKEKKRRTTKSTVKKASPFYNQVTVVVRIYEDDYTDLNEEKKINLKLFKNGSIQISGLKRLEYTNRALNKLIFRLSEIKGKLIDSKIETVKFIDENSILSIKDFNIYMINSNYKVNMKIDRSKLFTLLLKKKIKASYEKCIRACVIVKFIPVDCNDEEKEVSIFIFEKGNIIITGARNIVHIIESYNYINNILLTHTSEIIKKDDELEGELILKLYQDIIKENNHKLNL